MSLFSEDPAHLSKARLKLDLVAHNVALPPAKSKKEIYVELHLKHINQKNSADFSSDEEDQVRYVADEEEEEEEEEAEMADPSGLTDDDLMAALLKHGVKAGPIVASTRAVYEKKLRKLLQSDGHGCLNGVEQGVLYSDSEDEDENGEQEDEESGSEGAEEETHEQSDQAQQGSGQCFLPPSRLHAHSSRNRELSPKWNSGNVIQPLERSRPSCSKIPVGISRASSVDQRSGLGSGFPSGSVMPNDGSTISSQAFSITQMVEEMESSRSHSMSIDTERDLNGCNVQEHCSCSSRLDMPTPNKDNLKNQSLYYTPKASTYDWEIKEPMKDTFRDLLPNTNATPTGIYATRRRAIKGAAGRPVQYTYPDTPASPTTLERREVERRLVPVQIQILVFLIVVCLLYLIYVCVQDDSLSTFVALLDSLNQGTDSEEGLSLQAETRDAPALSGLE
ncbi:LEM domain-containing protein 1 isoform X2 [Anarrhichthys ocellatus]|uniref:LEM domain-containing protein 1 isoform X2 n=1 Tax=Anarrhichthys ocellatus TaxID=433405 RepID=UPI0012EE79C6|nr:lamina-associated polypeptide 2, isoforms beta/gamma-like isoform X2 [Anarrhichthys ocellatus]